VAPIGRICVAILISVARPNVGAPQAQEALPVCVSRLRRTDIRLWIPNTLATQGQTNVDATRVKVRGQQQEPSKSKSRECSQQKKPGDLFARLSRFLLLAVTYASSF
jgi:hypothetical protein